MVTDDSAGQMGSSDAAQHKHLHQEVLQGQDAPQPKSFALDISATTSDVAASGAYSAVQCCFWTCCLDRSPPRLQ